MEARLIDGRKVAQRLHQKVTEEVAALRSETGIQPGLAVVLVGQDPASEIYVNAKVRRTKEVGMASFAHHLAEDIAEDELIKTIEALNDNPLVHGILVQLPLPEHIDQTRVIETINPDKDVDGFTITNTGRLSHGLPCLVPCTPKGCMILIDEVCDDLEGKVVTIVGCSNIVGRPLIQLMLQRNCTVSVAHRFTKDTAAVVRHADIVVVAAGVPGLIRGDWLKPGAVVIDVGINRINEDGKTRIVGDVAFHEAVEVASAITPVPGGVGPMTIACLLANTVDAYRLQLAGTV
jgi:methylenetetrahydrofolate dehydrogenase (NADP+)/methenyltetrahydrofolate cyclohydrolase